MFITNAQNATANILSELCKVKYKGLRNWRKWTCAPYAMRNVVGSVRQMANWPVLHSSNREAYLATVALSCEGTTFWRGHAHGRKKQNYIVDK